MTKPNSQLRITLEEAASLRRADPGAVILSGQEICSGESNSPGENKSGHKVNARDQLGVPESTGVVVTQAQSLRMTPQGRDRAVFPHPTEQVSRQEASL